MLTTRGYVIKKTDITPKQLALLKKELTVSPLNFQNNVKISYPIWMESPASFYMPKWFGINKFGPPSVSKFSTEPLQDELGFDGLLRPEQEEPVANLLRDCEDPRKQGGILNVFCGGGKTTMALYVLCKLGLKSMIVVHKDFLLNQWKERIEQFLPKARIGYIKGPKCDVTSCDIVLASLQSLSMKEYDKDTFSGFGTLIIDEVHHTSAQVFNKALFKTCFKYSIGLTATLERKDGLSCVFIWHLGDISYKATQREDNVNIKILKYIPDIEEKEVFIKGSDKLNTARMVTNLTEDEDRDNLIIQELFDIIENTQRKTLVLSDRVNHLKKLHSIINLRHSSTAGIYVGGMKESALADCETKRVIFATYAIASEGYDQKGLDTLVLATPRTDITQSVGRILRDKEIDRKNIPTVIDIYDGYSIFLRQYQKRKAFYKKHNYNIMLHNNNNTKSKK
jgi:superfamily II DNA or RNA helicase